MNTSNTNFEPLPAAAGSGDDLHLTLLDREMLKLAARPDACKETRALILAAGAVQAGKATLEQVIAMLSTDGMPAINLPSEEGRMMGEELARLTGPCPGACSTCGYTAGTIPNQSPTTVAHALECTIDGAVFVCHSDGKPCRGWMQSRKSQNDKAEAPSFSEVDPPAAGCAAPIYLPDALECKFANVVPFESDAAGRSARAPMERRAA